MWTPILWPSLLVLVYLALFCLTLFLARRFTRGFDIPEPVPEEPAPPITSVRADATPEPAARQSA